VTNDELIKIIEKAHREKSPVLKLSHESISTLPPEIGHLKNLQELDLYINQLTTLPPEIGQLKNLQILRLESNELTTLPPEIGQLKSLRELYIIANELTTLPPEIGRLKNLQELYIGNNQLTTLPPKIGQLKNLQQLDLWKNQLTTLPPEIGHLKNLKYFNVKNNPLDIDIPPGILDKTDSPQVIINYYLENFKRWKTIKKIGKGGQGDVLLVEDKKNPGKRYAKKILRNWKSKKQQKRFEREIKIASEINHNNLIKIIDYEPGQKKDEAPYFIMEYCEGDLRNIQNQFWGNPEIILDFFLKMCNGVAALHKKGIVHRDLKPGNILIRDLWLFAI